MVLAQVVAVHSNNNSNYSSQPTYSSSSYHHRRLSLLRLLLETTCAFLHDLADGSSSNEALVMAGMGEAVVLVVEGLLAVITTQTKTTSESQNQDLLRLLALCCRVVALLAGPLSCSSSISGSNNSSRFLYPPSVNGNDNDDDDDDPNDEENEGADLVPTLSSLGLLVTGTASTSTTSASIASYRPRWVGVPTSVSDGMGLEPFSTRMFQIDMRKTLAAAAATVGSGVIATTAYRLRSSGCCETIVQVTNT